MRLRRDPVGLEGVHLVLHEGDQRRYDEREPVEAQRGELVTQRLAAPGRHQRQRVVAGEHAADDLLLQRPEALVAEPRLQSGMDGWGRLLIHIAGTHRRRQEGAAALVKELSRRSFYWYRVELRQGHLDLRPHRRVVLGRHGRLERIACTPAADPAKRPRGVKTDQRVGAVQGPDQRGDGDRVGDIAESDAHVPLKACSLGTA